MVRHDKESEGNLNQRINCYVSNAGTCCHSLWGGWVDHQCDNGGSETVVVGGVTSTQGASERDAQGKGSYITRRDIILSRGRTSRRIVEIIYDQRG